IDRADAEPRHEDFPHACFRPQPHSVSARVPAVEVADHRDATRIRRPDRETHPWDAIDAEKLRTELRSQFEMPALAEQMQIERAEQRAERIRVFGLLNRAAPLDRQEIRFR